jgi:hypothetical protein
MNTATITRPPSPRLGKTGFHFQDHRPERLQEMSNRFMSHYYSGSYETACAARMQKNTGASNQEIHQ